MKKLTLTQMSPIEAGKLDKVTTGVCGSSGALLASAVVFGIAGAATGGVGYVVGAGLSAYFGTTTGLLCAMM